ncbi:cyclic peptide export ABC transporter [Mucilaginibacter calamicampi]|uniref:Cyclic peptide export ABC transporter n=2 Tax=Mucilaginibacter calamicampi TaxID=1302352 RepID=A0ABW2YSB7_9SPHI
MTAISGLANAALLAVINYSTSKIVEHSYNTQLILIAIIVYLIYVLTKSRAQKLTAVFAETVVYNVRERIVKYLINTELQEFEELGHAQIYTRLTKDTNEISSSSSLIANGIQSAVLVFFALIYLGFLNTTALFITIVMVAIAISNYFINSNKIKKEIGEATDLETVYFETLNEVTGGFKEIKLHQEKKKNLFDIKLQSVAKKLKEKKTITSAKISFYFVFAQAFFYALLCTMVFVVPVLDGSVLKDLAKITPTILFIIIPLSEAVATFDVVNRATVAVFNLDQLEERLKKNAFGHAEDIVVNEVFNDFKAIQLNHLHFAYYDHAGKEQFAIGPIDVEINKGSTIFIVGGNGSGKSTLVRLLTGLYQPDNGTVSIDGEQITEDNIREYRELFGVIFSDFFLFSELYGVKDVKEKNVFRLLKQMELSDKTGYKDGAFTHLNLSTGQRKRLAMIATLLEDKNVLVFDEWAADQDPEFRKYFYNDLLPEFKSQGKTVIAITHDDQYFNKADKIYKMEYGKFNEFKV